MIRVGIANIPLNTSSRSAEGLDKIFNETIGVMEKFGLKVFELPYLPDYLKLSIIAKKLDIDPDFTPREEIMEKVAEFYETLGKEFQVLKRKRRERELWIYGPRYFDLISSEDARKISMKMLVDAAVFASMLKARGLIMNLGYAEQNRRKEALDRAIEAIRIARDAMPDESLLIGVEISGKKEVLGDLLEVTQVVKQVSRTIPVVHFGHYHARVGGNLHKAEDFFRVMESAYRASSVKDIFYIKITGVSYFGGEEVYHIPLSADSPPVRPFCRAIEMFVEAHPKTQVNIVVDSPLLEFDAEYIIKVLKEVTRLGSKIRRNKRRRKGVRYEGSEISPR